MEKRELKEQPHAELRELAGIYQGRSLKKDLAMGVAALIGRWLGSSLGS
jgi:hypothetical protein